MKPRGSVKDDMLSGLLLKLTSPMFLRTKRVRYGKNVRVVGSLPSIVNDGRIDLADDTVLRGPLQRVRMKTLRDGFISIGARSLVNDGTRIYAATRVDIADDCLIGDDCRIYDTNFHQVDEDGRAEPRPIVIERNVWLGRGVQVLPGVTIGEHSVIGAGSVVSHDIAPRTVARGNPAEPVREVRCTDAFKRR